MLKQVKQVGTLFLLALITFNANAFVNNDNDMEKVAQAVNQFAFDLYLSLAKKEKENILFSPYSISSALTMTYAGAKGRTQQQMAAVLYLRNIKNVHQSFAQLQHDLNSNTDTNAYQMHIANGLWKQQGTHSTPNFIDLLNNTYRTEIQELDFVKNTENARRTINHWTARQTDNKISSLLDKGTLTSLTRFVITNAIYLKAMWQLPFNEKLTKNQPFYLENGRKIDIPTMYQSTHEAIYAEDNEVQLLELLYQMGNGTSTLAMLIVLPKDKRGLKKVERTLNAQKLQYWHDVLYEKSVIGQKVHIYLPKFSMTASFKLNQHLSHLGMPDAFAYGKADFSDIIQGTKKRLAISAVIHQACIDVNEMGTEATAATAVIGTLRGGTRSTATFRADHPFLFIIKEQESGTILFLGRVSHPDN